MSLRMLWSDWSASCLCCFTPWEDTWYPLNRWLGGSQSWFGCFEKIFCPWWGSNDSSDVQPVGWALYRPHYPNSQYITFWNSPVPKFRMFLSRTDKIMSGLPSDDQLTKNYSNSLNLCHKIFLPHILLSHIYNFGASYLQTFSSEVFKLLLFTVISEHCNLPSFDNTSTKTLTITFTLVNSMFTFTIQWQIKRQMTVMNYTTLQLISLPTIL